MVEVLFKFIKQEGMHKVLTITRKNGNLEAFIKLVKALKKIHNEGKKSNLMFDARTKQFLFMYVLDGFSKYDLEQHKFYKAEFKTSLSKNEEYINFLIVGKPEQVVIEYDNNYVEGYL